MHFPKLPDASYLDSGDVIVVYSCQIIITLLSFGVAFFTTIWCLYFLSRIRELSRKIHYLKKQTEERCYEELTNAKVDYIKYIFIAAICFFEVFPFYFVLILVIIFNIYQQQPINNCPGGNYLIEEIYNYSYIRVLLAMEIASVVIYMSLVHILTSYLSHTYETKRIITLTRRDKVLISCLLIQLVVIGISTVSFHVFLFVLLSLALFLFPIHLCLYVKYSRRLYMLLKRRRLDAWFEDPDSYKKLVGMCKEYKTGSILYTVCIVCFSCLLLSIYTFSFIRMLLHDPCMLNEIFFNLDSVWLSYVYKNNTQGVDIIFRIYDVSINIFGVFAVSLFVFYHLYICCGAVARMVKRRRAFKKYTGIRSGDLFRPLIGTK